MMEKKHNILIQFMNITSQEINLAFFSREPKAKKVQ